MRSRRILLPNRYRFQAPTLDFTRVNEDFTDLIRQRIAKRNLSVFRYVAGTIALMSLFHLGTFIGKLPGTDGTQRMWVLGILAGHALLLLGSTALGAIWWYATHRITWTAAQTARVVALVMPYFLAIGVFITLVDQWVTPAITPFFVVSIGIGVVFLLPPRLSGVLFTAGFLAMYLLLPLTQGDADMLLSNRVNAFTTSVIGFVLSFVLWRSEYANYRQQEIIERQNAELAEKTVVLNAMVATKDKLFSIIAHDLRSPFSSILGFSELMHREQASLSREEVAEYAGIIHHSSEQALHLLENLLRWARMQQGVLQFAPRPLSLAALTREVMASVSLSALQKQVEVQVEIPESLSLEADSEMLRTILRNLLGNAVKFTPTGGQVLFSAIEDPNGVQMMVRDTGLGIERDRLSSIWGSGVTTAGTQNEPGSGLGLVLVKEFVEKHGGTIRVQSTPGSGTTFTLFFPAKG